MGVLKRHSDGQAFPTEKRGIKSDSMHKHDSDVVEYKMDDEMTEGMERKREHKIETSRNFISHFGDAKELGIDKFDGVVGTYISGSGKNYKIVAYGQGHTFTKDSLNHIADNMKKYELSVYDDPEAEYEKIYAIDDELATNFAKHHLLKEGTKFQLFEITPNFKKVV